MESIIQTDEQLDAWLRQNEQNMILFENARKGHLDQVRDSLQKGAECEFQTWYCQRHAPHNDEQLVCEQLNCENSDVNANANAGFTALIVASGNSHEEVVRLLRQCGCACPG